MSTHHVARICIGCQARAPRVETDYTLISSRFGWRLSRRLEADGSLAVEWRCPGCWDAHKQGRVASPVSGERRALRTTPTMPDIAPQLRKRHG